MTNVLAHVARRVSCPPACEGTRDGDIRRGLADLTTLTDGRHQDCSACGSVPLWRSRRPSPQQIRGIPVIARVPPWSGIGRRWLRNVVPEFEPFLTITRRPRGQGIDRAQPNGDRKRRLTGLTLRASHTETGRGRWTSRCPMTGSEANERFRAAPSHVLPDGLKKGPHPPTTGTGAGHVWRRRLELIRIRGGCRRSLFGLGCGWKSREGICPPRRRDRHNVQRGIERAGGGSGPIDRGRITTRCRLSTSLSNSPLAASRSAARAAVCWTRARFAASRASFAH